MKAYSANCAPPPRTSARRLCPHHCAPIHRIWSSGNLPHCSGAMVRSETCVWPSWIGSYDSLADTFDGWNELHPAGFDLVTQKPVDFERMVRIGLRLTVTRTLYSTPCFLQAAAGPASPCQRLDCRLRSTRWTSCSSRGTVDADADQKVVFTQRTRTIRRSAGCRWSAWCSRRSCPAGGIFPGASMARL
jgi:hypothetical protein